MLVFLLLAGVCSANVLPKGPYSDGRGPWVKDTIVEQYDGKVELHQRAGPVRSKPRSNFSPFSLQGYKAPAYQPRKPAVDKPYHFKDLITHLGGRGVEYEPAADRHHPRDVHVSGHYEPSAQPWLRSRQTYPNTKPRHPEPYYDEPLSHNNHEMELVEDNYVDSTHAEQSRYQERIYNPKFAYERKQEQQQYPEQPKQHYPEQPKQQYPEKWKNLLWKRYKEPMVKYGSQSTESKYHNQPEQHYPEHEKKQHYAEQPKQHYPEQPKQHYPEQPKQHYPEQPKQHYPEHEEPMVEYGIQSTKPKHRELYDEPSYSEPKHEAPQNTYHPEPKYRERYDEPSYAEPNYDTEFVHQEEQLSFDYDKVPEYEPKYPEPKYRDMGIREPYDEPSYPHYPDSKYLRYPERKYPVDREYPEENPLTSDYSDKVPEVEYTEQKYKRPEDKCQEYSRTLVDAIQLLDAKNSTCKDQYQVLREGVQDRTLFEYCLESLLIRDEVDGVLETKKRGGRFFGLDFGLDLDFWTGNGKKGDSAIYEDDDWYNDWNDDGWCRPRDFCRRCSRRGSCCRRFCERMYYETDLDYYPCRSYYCNKNMSSSRCRKCRHCHCDNLY